MFVKVEDRSDPYLNGTASEDRRPERTDRDFRTFSMVGPDGIEPSTTEV